MSAPMRDRFGYRHRPIGTALVGIAALALGFVVSISADRLPLIGHGTEHQAEFTEASGLTVDSPVRIAGVRVGVVTGIELVGDHVRVSFATGDAWIGDRSTAAIKLSTLFGSRYLAVDPRGYRELGADESIPRQRTASLYDLTNAFAGVADTLGRIDTPQLAEGLRVLADVGRGTSEEYRGALDGLSALSTTISARDAELRNLLDRTASVSRVVAARDEDMRRLLHDGSLLIGAIEQRRVNVRALLDGTRALSTELTGLVTDSQAEIGPTLRQLERVAGMLERNQHALDLAASKLGYFHRVITSPTGTGRWADVYVCGLLPPSTEHVNPEGCHP